jgi:hypothetical protein
MKGHRQRLLLAPHSALSISQPVEPHDVTLTRFDGHVAIEVEGKNAAAERIT